MEIVVGALPSLLPKLADLLIGEYYLQKEVKSGIIFLQAELETMKAALEEISETPADKLNRVDKIWARDVRELSYDIEDKIDTFMVCCKAGSKVAKAEQHSFKKAIDRSLNWLMRPNIRRKIAIDIRDIKSRVLEVPERRHRYEFNNKHSVDKPVNEFNNKHSVDKHVKVDPRALVRYEDVTKLVGIDEARDEVIRILIQGNEVSMQQQDKIVSIVGFGGLGKTTLASVVYEKLKREFDCSAFVSVSQTPDMEKLFNNLLYQLGKRNNISIDVIIDDLREFLQEKRYLIVIDDIWETSVWKTITYALPVNNHGRRIITTTRILKVAEEVGGAYKMRPLCLHDSRILFYRRIFGIKDEEKCPNDELAEVSDRILTKCAGVPLAIITIASLLATKGTNKLDWYEVYNSIGRGIEGSEDVGNMINILSFSYYNLPFHLRTCLLYLRVFPEDYEIEKRHLIWMWISEGFIHCRKQGESLFEVGESYFNELINASMIQAVYDRNGMKIHSCSVHDMVLELIHSISREENFTTTLNDVGHISSSQKVRRLCLQNYKEDHGTLMATMNMQQVRSVVVFSSAVNLIPALSSFEVLRVLNLEDCDFSHGYNLKYIGKLVHLRCLGLRSHRLFIPKEIENLQFLQVLDISRKYVGPTSPFKIVQLRQLKCLYINDANSKEERPRLLSNGIINGFGGLTSLEELSRLHISVRTGNNDLEELGHLTELRVLDISGYFNEQPLVECLHKLQKLQNLSIYFEGRFKGNLFGWVGPQNLRSLQVDGCCLPKLPVWINHSHVQNLSLLKINVDELQQQDLETLGRLPALCNLHMWLARFSIISGEFVISHGLFPSLVHCKLLGYYDERLVFQHGAMPRLRSLELDISRDVWSTWTVIPDMGFENLLSLLDLRVGLSASGYRGDARKAWAALRNMAENHPNHPSISAADHWN